MKSTNNNKLDAVQMLRGIAVLFVVTLHFSSGALHFWNRILRLPAIGLPYLKMHGSVGSFLSFGYIGVDIFFIISGFIMFYTTRTKPGGIAQASKFIINRITRIFPLFYIVVFSFILLFPIILYLGHHENFLTWTMIAKVLSLQWGNTVGKTFLGIRWTLTFELYFYFVFTFAMLFSYKKRIYIILAWIVSLTILLPLFLGIPFNFGNFKLLSANTSLSNFTSLIIWEFFIGGMMAIYYEKIVQIPQKIAAFLFYSWLVCFLIVATNYHLLTSLYFQHHSLPVTVFATWFVLAFLSYQEKLLVLLPNKLIYIGNISYSLYLVHHWVQEITDPIKMFYMPLGLVCSFILAHYSHKYIETRLSVFLRSKLINQWEIVLQYFANRKKNKSKNYT